MPRVAGRLRRLALWVDSDGSGFLRSKVLDELHLQKARSVAYLPPLEENGFPAPTGNHGALPILDDAQVSSDPIFAGIDGQLGWSWLQDRIWTIDYVGHHIYVDHSAPAVRSADTVPLAFDRDHRFPKIDIAIDGKTYHATLDTAATVALSQQTVSSLADGLPPVRATSFIPQRTLQAWHAAHPDWPFIANAGVRTAVSLIRVPEVRASRVTFRDVWFSARPGDDVFEGETVDAKLGPTAFSNCAVTIDYVHDASAFECRV